MQILEHEPMSEEEQPTLQKIARLLQDNPSASLLIGTEGEVIELPKAVVQVLKQVITHIGRSQSIFAVSDGPMLTTQEAADLLDVSRPHMIKLLKEAKIPYTEVGSHRRIHVDDVLQYKQVMSEGPKRNLMEIIRVIQQIGLYGPMLTAEEAAEIIGSPRPHFLEELFQKGEIPYTEVDAQRRIHISDLLRYIACRQEEQEKGLVEIMRISEEMGLYDEEYRLYDQ